MKTMIRWQGLGVFGGVAAFIFLFTFFFADGFIQGLVEMQGSKLVGARVNLGGADVSFFPAGLELADLQITNPDNPMRNSVEIDRITVSIDTMKLLQRKIIVNEMVVDGIRPDTARRKSGALPEYAARKKDSPPPRESKGFKMPSLQIPDAKEILAKEKLLTIDLANEYQDEIKADSARWKQQLAELPDKKKLALYRERLNKVKSSSGFAGILGGMGELSAIRKEIQADLDRLKSAQKDFATLSDSYRTRLAKIQEAPQQDIKRLSEKYSLSAKGLANLSPLLFGEQTGGMIEQALSWYTKAQPLLERAKEKKNGSETIKPARGKGVVVRFTEDEPLPDFLIRNISASVQIAAGSFTGSIKNVTPDQDILGAPLTFSFAGDSLQGIRAVSFAGTLDHIKPAQSHDTVQIKIKEYSLEKATLNSDQNLPATLTGGTLDLTVQAVLKEQEINVDIRAGLKSAKFSPSASDRESDAASRAIADALSGITDLSGRAKITGTIDNYKMELSSDLDKILEKAVANTLKSQTAKFEQKLKDGVMEKVKGPLSQAGGGFADLDGISQELSARLQQIGNLI
ncbi:MAG: TIGR03545 family protein [Proteobacteria bacterium]|nr:TIGR03545 family protein [Pseudomonadota bacterium]MBU1739766.1 TIGR03545 family protein [Pseudomonadota bacterium]